MTRWLIEQVQQVAGPQAISLLLADALSADGPLLAWLKYGQGIAAPRESLLPTLAKPSSLDSPT